MVRTADLPPSSTRDLLWVAVTAELALAAGLFASAGLLSENEATGHARYHAMLAVASLVVAGILLRIRPDAGIGRRAPAFGLLLVAAAQLVEGVGALGFGPDGNTRARAIVEAHDLGLAATGLAMLALAVGLAVSAAAVVRARTGGRIIPGVVAVIALAAGLLFVRMMVGL